MFNFEEYIDKFVAKTVVKVTEDSVWEEKPVNPKEFFSKWCKPSLTEPQLEAIDSIFENDFENWSKQYVEYLLLWGEGSGKDFICVRIVVYICYWLLCHRDPQSLFKLASLEPIDIVNISVNGPHARDVFFKRFTNVLREVRNPKTGKNWFAEKGMDLRNNKDIQTTKAIFPKNITAYSLNSVSYAGEGKNIILAVFDEVGEFVPHKAKEIYDALWFTAESRYGSKEGSLQKILLISYLRDEFDFMNYRWTKSKDDFTVFRSKKSTWEVRPNKTKEDYKRAFEKSPEDAARRYSNILSDTLNTNFFKSKEKVRLFAKNRNSPFEGNPKKLFDMNEAMLAKWFRPGQVEELYLLIQNTNRSSTEEQRLKLLQFRHEGARYNIHIDLAKGLEGGDCAGFAMGHPYLISPEMEEDDEIEISDKYAIYVDLMLQLKGVNGKEVDFEKIRKFIYKLLDMRFEISEVTLDGYESVDFRQQLETKNIVTDLQSVDRTLAPYQTFKEVIYTQRLDYRNYFVFLREAEELQLTKKRKVDHPDISNRRSLEENDERGSKDVSDAVTGIVYRIIKSLPEESDFVVSS